MYIGITTKTGLRDSTDIVRKTVSLFERRGAKVDVCEGTCRLLPNRKPGLDFTKNYDMIIVFGGDGTLLRTIQFMKHFDHPVLHINMGRLGFFAEKLGKEYKSMVEKVMAKKYHTESRMMLRCTVERGKRRAFSKRALNEVTLARDALARMVSLKTTVDDLKLTTYVADGLIVATPTGSTGYSLSSGGPVVSPRVDGIILTPISPHSFTQRPIIIPHTSKIKIQMTSTEGRLHLTMDGQSGFHLKDDDLVKIKRSSKTLKLVRFNKNSYFKTLRKKLHWGSDLSGR
jgi:NAD+ kinase